MERANQPNGSARYSRRRRPGAAKRRDRSPNRNPTDITSTDKYGSPTSPILGLPDDVLYVIFQYLNPETLCKLCRVCQRFRQLASEDSVWLPHEKEHTLLRSCNSR
ncbi:MAG: F-box protein [Cocleimonas sp.]|nr:F-box protein [Cocleimonas sp.]